MKFVTDRFDDRIVEHKDSDGARLQVRLFDTGKPLILVNGQGVTVARKKLRKLARAILKETRK